MKGKLIVIEGLDGSGKATQAKLLADTLAEQGENVRKITFPDYESDSSALVKMYLKGEFGSKPGDVNHDNKVDIDDVTMLIDSVLGKPSGICEVCADLDGNSKVDIDDVTAAITIVLTGSY